MCCPSWLLSPFLSTLQSLPLSTSVISAATASNCLGLRLSLCMPCASCTCVPFSFSLDASHSRPLSHSLHPLPAMYVVRQLIMQDPDRGHRQQYQEAHKSLSNTFLPFSFLLHGRCNPEVAALQPCGGMCRHGVAGICRHMQIYIHLQFAGICNQSDKAENGRLRGRERGTHGGKTEHGEVIHHYDYV